MGDTAVRLWPDDIKRAAATLALAASVPCDLAAVIASVEAAVEERPVPYVVALIQGLTAGLEDQFSNPAIVAAFQQTAAQAQAHEDQLRADGEWRNDVR